jgi:hypothetical protein
MFKIKITILFIVTISAIVIALWYVSVRVYSFYGNRIEKVSIGNNVFYSEVISSVDKMHKGLGGRGSLCQSCAMLFKFPDSGRYAFSMKDMRFPLDIIWILNGKIVYLEKNVSEKFSDIMISSADADQVLEINAGNIDKLGIEIGNKVSF